MLIFHRSAEKFVSMKCTMKYTWLKNGAILAIKKQDNIKMN